MTIDTPENMRAASLDWISQGYRTIRIKLGVGSLKQDMELVRNIREAIGTIQAPGRPQPGVQREGRPEDDPGVGGKRRGDLRAAHLLD